jgi:hypothetical protein
MGRVQAEGAVKKLLGLPGRSQITTQNQRLDVIREIGKDFRQDRASFVVSPLCGQLIGCIKKSVCLVPIHAIFTIKIVFGA